MRMLKELVQHPSRRGGTFATGARWPGSVNGRPQFVRGFGITVLDGVQDARDVAHGVVAVTSTVKQFGASHQMNRGQTPGGVAQ